jgi:hypothetical protein
MKKRWLAVCSFIVVTAAFHSSIATAQQPCVTAASTPDATASQPPPPQLMPQATPTPTPTASPTPTPAADDTNSSVSTSASAPSGTVGNAAEPVCLCVKGKFKYFMSESFRPGIYPVAAAYTAVEMANPPKAYPPEWRQGFGGFARNFGDFMASWVSVQGGKFVVASAIHEDPRYFPSKSKNFFARTFNAARFAVVDRSDGGHPRPAIANFAGAFAGGFVGNAYLPHPYANASHGLSRSGFALLGFVTSNLADEFHPEIRRIATKLHLPFIGK